MAPRGRIAFGHDVGVPLEQEASSGPDLAEPGHDVGTRRRHGLDLDREPFLGEPALHECGDGGLVAVGIAGLDDAGDADEVARQRDQLVFVDLRQRVAQTCALSHSGDYSCGKDRMTASSRMTRNSSLAM